MVVDRKRARIADLAVRISLGFVAASALGMSMGALFRATWDPEYRVTDAALLGGVIAAGGIALSALLNLELRGRADYRLFLSRLYGRAARALSRSDHLIVCWMLTVVGAGLTFAAVYGWITGTPWWWRLPHTIGAAAHGVVLVPVWRRYFGRPDR